MKKWTFAFIVSGILATLSKAQLPQAVPLTIKKVGTESIVETVIPMEKGATLECSPDLRNWTPTDHTLGDGEIAQMADSMLGAASVGYLRVATYAAAPEAPATLTAVVDPSGSVILTWNLDQRRAEGIMVMRSLDDGEDSDSVAELPPGSRTWTDHTAPVARPAHYYVAAYNDADVVPSDELQLTVVPPAPPDPPELRALWSGSAVQLTWQAAPSWASGFQLYRIHAGQTQLLAAPAANTASYQDTNVGPGMTIDYKLLYVAVGGISPHGAAAQVAIPAIPPTPPGVPGGPSLAWTGSAISLTWSPGSGLLASTIIERSTDGTAFSRVSESAAPANSWSDATASPGDVYTYRLTSCGPGGYSVPSAAVSITPTLSAPGSRAPTNRQTGVHRPVPFSWGRVTGAAAYELMLYFVPDGVNQPLQLVDTLRPTGTTASSTACGPGRTYQFKVRALTASGTGSSAWSSSNEFSTRVNP